MKTSYKHYQIIEKIGSGGMATLYLAQDTRLNRSVALKILHPSFGADAEYIARFEREAREAAALNHRNIVTIHDFGSEDEAYFIVMEYVDGMDLRSAILDVPLTPMEVGLAVIEEAASALEALHQRHLVHRDVKPANILLSRDGEVKITDFGLTKRADSTGSLGLTVPGSVIGTAYYMSPEQAIGKDVDARSDIFSLGVTAYEVFSGVKPFQGKTYSEVVDRLITATPEPMVALSPLVTPQIEALVLKMMAKEPGRRPQSMQEVQQELEACWETLPNNVRSARQRREILRQFLADPSGFSRQLWRENLQRCLERGKYYMSLGLDRFDDAVQEFRVALRIDPNNERAGAALAELGKARDIESLTRTVRNDESAAPEVTAVAPAVSATASAAGPGMPPVVDPADAPEPPRTPKPEPLTAPPRYEPPPPVRPAGAGRARRFWLPLAATVVVVAVLGGALLMRRGGKGPERQEENHHAVIDTGATPDTTKHYTPIGQANGGSPQQDRQKVEPPVLLVDSRPAGAEVLLRRGGEAGAFRPTGQRTPCRITLAAPGSWEVSLSLAGYRSRSASVEAGAGTSSVGPVELTEAPPTGRLAVVTTPAGAALTLRGDGRSGGGRFRAPLSARELEAGSWDLRATLPGYVTLDTSVVVEAGRLNSVALALRAEAVVTPAGEKPTPVPRRATVGYTVFRISVFPPAQLFLDNSLYQKDPDKVFFVRATPDANHVIEVRTGDNRSHRWDNLHAAAGDTTQVPHFTFPK